MNLEKETYVNHYLLMFSPLPIPGQLQPIIHIEFRVRLCLLSKYHGVCAALYAPASPPKGEVSS